MRTPIVDFLTEHYMKNPASFHMPGHKGSRLYERFGYGEFLTNIFDCDVTEIIGADNLFHTEGIIKEAQEKYARLYDVKNSYLLINGTSGGIIASILASVPKGGNLIMARNCHKSVFNGLALAGAEPVYAYPEFVEEYGILGAVRPEEIQRLIDENPEASAVILPSPNYYGICSDIESIARIVHGAGKVLIVDQAHGAHLKFFEGLEVSGMDKLAYPKSAETQGADIVINSIHKTLGSLTQSAVLNLNSDRVDRYVLEDKLQMIQSTSPSYILMSSLDINASLVEEYGQQLMQEWNENLIGFYKGITCIEGIHAIGNPYKGGTASTELSMDLTKINLVMGGIGLTGAETEHLLLEKGVFMELTTGDIVMAMSGIGNERQHFHRLLEGLRQIAAGRDKKPIANRRCNRDLKVFEQFELVEIPEKKERIPLKKAVGRICASSVIPYPPGIPLICPGEIFTEEAVAYIKELRKNGEKIIGLSEQEEILAGRIL